MLKGFKLKKVECWAKKKWLNRLCSSNQGPVEGGQKVSLSPSGLLFPVKVEPQPVEVRSRTSWGLVEVQRSLFLTVSQSVDP